MTSLLSIDEIPIISTHVEYLYIRKTNLTKNDCLHLVSITSYHLPIYILVKGLYNIYHINSYAAEIFRILHHESQREDIHGKAEKRVVSKISYHIEKVGNKLPHPVTLFALLALLVIILDRKSTRLNSSHVS